MVQQQFANGLHGPPLRLEWLAQQLVDDGIPGGWVDAIVDGRVLCPDLREQAAAELGDEVVERQQGAALPFAQVGNGRPRQGLWKGRGGVFGDGLGDWAVCVERVAHGKLLENGEEPPLREASPRG